MQTPVTSADSQIVNLTKLTQSLRADLARAHRQIEIDAREVGELQRSLLPHPFPRVPGLEIAASYEPCTRASGDLYDVFPLDDASPLAPWCIFIGDASGHGLAAAVVISMVHSILRAHPPRISSPAALLEHSNSHLCRKQLRGFVTAFVGIYEPVVRRLTYACAGHPPPLLKASTSGAVRRLDAAASYPLGIDPGNTFIEASIRLRAGDTILLYTDGITEARNLADEMFSQERLEGEFERCRQRPAGLIGHLANLVDTHGQGRYPSDDQTLLAIAETSSHRDPRPVAQVPRRAVSCDSRFVRCG
jgi:sigma-B regulation protein RsbU (phosphoserine phosphatase)